ncbi:MAG TPA: hypothetical protein VII06_36810 [Chloroflexota bacterium]|jgi:hypothetical protein
MKPKTGDYLAKAEANRAIAITLIDPSRPGRPPYEWVIVIVFQAAIDYVQALLYERTFVEHSNHHRARRGAFAREPEASAQSQQGRSLLDHYDVLEARAHQARYELGFTAHRIDVDEVLYENFDPIRSVVGAALAWTPPP